jgi:gluconate kinase
MDCAQPLAQNDRGEFLQAVAAEIEQQRQRGPGAVYRACRELQRKFFDPPISTGREYE